MFNNIEYDFDEEIDRKNTNCAKYDGLERYFGYKDLNPLWVADMDFKTPKFINDAIIEATQKSVYGYSIDTPELYTSIINWQKMNIVGNKQRRYLYDKWCSSSL